MTATPTPLTKSAFARHLGCAPSYVTKLKDEGRLVLDAAGRVLVAESVARIESTGGKRQDVAQRHAQARGQLGAGLPGAGQGGHGGSSSPRGEAATPPGGVESKAMATSRKETAQADMAEMERDTMRGNLIKREDVDAAMKFIGATIHSLLDTFPGQYAPVLAPVSDIDEVEAQLSEACRNVQVSLGEAIARQKQVIAERGKA